MKKTNTTKETMKQAIKDMTKKLGLNQYPIVKIELEDSNYVMAATGTVYTRGKFFNETIAKTESDYVLHINKQALNKQLKRYAYIFGNKQAAYDCLYLLICHELRHMWQYQEQWLVGKPYNKLSSNLNELKDGHGSTPIEMDANNWMIQIAEKRNIKYIAYFMELEQRSSGLINMYDEEFTGKVKSAYLDAISNYNKVMHCLYKFSK